MSLNVGQKEAAVPAEINPYVQEYVRLAPQTGQKPAEVRQAVLKIAAERKVNEVVALGIWKSQNKNRLGGLVATFTGRVLFVEGPRAAQVDGRTTNVSNLGWVVKNGENYELRQMSLWDGDSLDSARSALATQVQVDGLYSFRGSVKPTSEATISLVEGGFAPSNDPFATPEQLAQAKPESLAAAIVKGKKGRALVLTQGIVGRAFATQRGGGIELSDVGVDVPVTAFFAIPLNGVAEGVTLKVLGQITEKQGVATMNGYRFWVVG